jgi:hypothetical protein
METADVVGIITQALSLIDRTPIRYESIRPALGACAEPQEHPRREYAVRPLCHANALASPDRAKLPDYIEVILHCKGACRSVIQHAYILFRSGVGAHKAQINRNGHPPFGRNGKMFVRPRSSFYGNDPRRVGCDEFVCFLTSHTPSHSILPCHV